MADLSNLSRQLRETEFPGIADTIYFNNAGIGPIPERTRLVLEELNASKGSPHSIDVPRLFKRLAQTRRSAARLLNAETVEIGLTTSTTLGLNIAAQALPDAPHVAVFDTAFHQTMPDRAYMYALPHVLYERFRIRRYGFHGSSHRYLARRLAKLAGAPREEMNIVTAHLGNGASMAAIRGGRSVDTSMGFTPLEGVPMGTR